MDDRINPDGLYSPKRTANLENVCLALIYSRLGRGEYDPVFKDGSKTQITGQAILDRRRKHLKPAEFKPPKPQPSRFGTIRRKPTEINVT